MIEFSNGGILVQDISELPNLRGELDIILDLETTSGDDKKDSLNPHHNCSTLGVAIKPRKHNRAWYIPVGHRYDSNLPKEHVRNWLNDIIVAARMWRNHNIKYDMHVMGNDLHINVDHLEIWDTLTQAKLVDSDRLNYSQDSLSKDWLNEDITQYQRVFDRYLRDHNGNKVIHDYGVISAREMGEYACQDVITNDKLVTYIQDNMPPESGIVSENEAKLTPILYRCERIGMHIDPTAVAVKHYNSLTLGLKCEKRIAELTGRWIRPHVGQDCYELLCMQEGLPVLEWTNEDDDTKKSNPSFNKKAIKGYLHHPKVRADKRLQKVIKAIGIYRKYEKFATAFCAPYSELHIDGWLHHFFNQCVRTGRLSCSMPNMQQLSDLAKELIIPPEGYSVLDIDLSQIEFRLIVETIGNMRIIDEYIRDPKTDYHTLVAKLAGISRAAAKNLNFAIAFGAGMAKAIAMVKASLDISAKGFEGNLMDFDAYCGMKAKETYTAYHNLLPELNPTKDHAQTTALRQGYITNMYGRRRYLRPYYNPKRRRRESPAFKAFNSYIQSSAADFAKACTIKIADYLSATRCGFFGVVHDSWLIYCPIGEEEHHRDEIIKIIENERIPNKQLRIPITANGKYSSVNWRQAA